MFSLASDMALERLLEAIESFSIGGLYAYQIFAVVSLNLYVRRQMRQCRIVNVGDLIFNYATIAFSGGVFTGELEWMCCHC